MNRSTRALAAVVATAALTLTGQAMQTAATAKPQAAGAHVKGGTHAKSDASKVLRDIARKTAQLDRAVSASRIGTLAEDVQAVVVANVEADKTALAALGETATRDDLRAVRVENYVLAVNVLRHAARLQEAAAANAEAATLVESATAKALTVTAASPKSLLREARADLAGAQELLDADADADIEETEPVVPTAPVEG